MNIEENWSATREGDRPKPFLTIKEIYTDAQQQANC